MKHWIVACTFANLFVAAVCLGQSKLSKGHRLLIEHGLQIQGMATKDDVFSLQRYQEANYTAINWLFDADPSKHGAAPGFPWARWVSEESKMPPVPGEEPYMSKLVALSFGDEKNLNDPKIRTPYIKWFNDYQAKYPNVILYANNYGGQVSDETLTDFITHAHPDMIVFDTYPWLSNYTSKKPAPPAGGSPANWYSELRRYREHARGGGIPMGTYRQTFHAEQDYDQHIYRDPSPSEFRLNTFGALAFNAKFLIDFTYNTGASSLFTKPGGDTHPTPLYHVLQQTNAEARNLGKALVRLKPIEDIKSPDGHTTGMMFIRGKHAGEHGERVANTLPVSFQPDPQSREAYSDWESDRNDPYLRGWTVANLGKANGGLSGDVIISWFKPIDESLDGEKFHDEIYVMVTNGLSDMHETGRQRITLNFVDALETATIQRISRESGKIEELKLPLASQRRQLILELDGGVGELFKFKTGAPFVH